MVLCTFFFSEWRVLVRFSTEQLFYEARKGDITDFFSSLLNNQKRTRETQVTPHIEMEELLPRQVVYWQFIFHFPSQSDQETAL
jgi:hypothetical protein